jgi:hypothetical protein
VGTSASSKGPRSNSPLVPEWADADPSAPLPSPTGQRFRAFRTEFGRVAAKSAGASLTSALGRYAREATGGSSIGPRRFGPAYSAAPSFAQAIAELKTGGTGEAATGTDLRRLVGQPIDYAAQEIARALAPENADADQIAIAIQEAIAEVLPEDTTFVPEAISTDQVIQILVEFFSRIVFQEITGVAGNAWNRAPSAARTTELEAELLEIVRVTVDKHLSARLVNGLATLDREQIKTIERAAITEVWREWESHQ